MVTRDQQQEGRCASRLAYLRIGLVVLGVTFAAPCAALAELGPPSPAPAVSKRKCARYSVVNGPAGPAARCSRYHTQTLRRSPSRSRPGGAAGNNLAASTRSASALSHTVGRNGANATRVSSHVVPNSVPTQGARKDVTAPKRSSSVPLGIVLAAIAAAALTAAVLLALARNPVVRHRNNHARGPAV
jgi:hypothetical protein